MKPETALSFSCAGETLVGIAAPGAPQASTGVVIVVGGPQYRIGSHRQFVQLARALSAAGVPSLRFDCRGMGDSSGAPRAFEDLSDDIAAGIDALQASHPAVRRVILWGLCDGASAAMMYAPEDPRVAGLVLANPWARGADTESKAMLSHYYLQRVMSASFWRKLLTGGVRLRSAATEVAGRVSSAASRTSVPFRDRMEQAMRRFAGPALFIICDRDVTGREFLAYARGVCRSTFERRAGRDRWVHLQDADHTFSGAVATAAAAQATIEWIASLEPAPAEVPV
jgi:exosortase A-associated hydrolase 1